MLERSLNASAVSLVGGTLEAGIPGTVCLVRSRTTHALCMRVRGTRGRFDYQRVPFVDDCSCDDLHNAEGRLMTAAPNVDNRGKLTGLRTPGLDPRGTLLGICVSQLDVYGGFIPPGGDPRHVLSPGVYVGKTSFIRCGNVFNPARREIHWIADGDSALIVDSSRFCAVVLRDRGKLILAPAQRADWERYAATKAACARDFEDLRRLLVLLNAVGAKHSDTSDAIIARMRGIDPGYSPDWKYL